MEAESEMSLIERIEEMPSDCVVEEWKSGRVEEWKSGRRRKNDGRRALAT